MRRTRMIRLVAIGTTGLVGLAGCDDAETVLGKGDFFKDAQECSASVNPDACRQGLADARAEHLRTAPRFATKQECEVNYGADNCEVGAGAPPAPASSTTAPTQTASSGGSFFMPLMMGYMMGRTLGGGYSATPLYRDAANTAYSGTRTLGRIDAGAAPALNTAPGAATRTAQRGGFGSTGSSSAAS